MPFTQAELDYLASQQLGRLATAQPGGTLQNNPVGFTYNPTTKTIDVRGFGMAKSRKYRNVLAGSPVAFVVDDIYSVDPWRVRCLEIRGRAEAIPDAENPDGPLDGAIIRIHPERIISFGVDRQDVPAHEMKADIRNVQRGSGN
ncbi:pyridoxamine 5'-phosphate oxidase family protein [Kibdelosporangium banguiense]|uniref:Pyridoxamine 5'-phosphate oxidase family protein n=1 Tax=Kibdelosporangium banguiense TaxID=1365924 RepID=A0ABS4T7N3_9PSEU|nr:PPOX class F420-dependent oxidoreductase [Kibdelosporangium banguiense]MBP2319944.1 pyridoxamine 5'-phosphate oxidase family protein [Kibdelosporangium banguiense]